MIGIVIATATKSEVPPDKLKPILEMLDDNPLFKPIDIKLLTWASDYYHYPIGEVFAAALPTYLRQGKALPVIKPENIPTNNDQIFNLSMDQQTAIATVQNYFNKFQTFLLNGVTGSGKTEVYLQLIKNIIEQGKQALFLVPEISLTPQTIARVTSRFNVPIAILHSELAPKQRALAWHKAISGVAKVIIGTRSAALLPINNLGLIIIDEEHDVSFKQQDKFRYSARDLAIKRGQLQSCPVILGSATPSLESIYNAQHNKYITLELPSRINQQIPDIKIIDIKNQKLNAGLSPDLLTAITKHLASQQQVLIFLNRRGYAPVLMCYACGWHAECKHCDSQLVLHKAKNKLRCHHCSSSIEIPLKCHTCNSENLNPIGVGTEQIELALQQHFPDANIARVDKDTTQSRKALQIILDNVNSLHTNILLGTQMLAKGHDFPNLTLVAIVDVDSGLFSSDFRSLERMAQLITQVAGRAGRADKPGEVILQTCHPQHKLLQTLVTQGYMSCTKYLLQERQDAALPPFGKQALIRAAAKKEATSMNALALLKNLARDAAKKLDIHLAGPIPAPMQRRIGFYHSQLLVQAAHPGNLQKLLVIIAKLLQDPKLGGQIRWSVDVNPLDML